MIVEVKTEDELKYHLTIHDVCIVDFYANWCKSCKEMFYDLDVNIKLLELEEQIMVLKVNIDDMMEYALTMFEDEKIKIPYVMVYHKGRFIKSYTGYNPKLTDNTVSRIMEDCQNII